MEQIKLKIEDFEMIVGKKDKGKVYKYLNELDRFKIECYTIDGGKSFVLFITEKRINKEDPNKKLKPRIIFTKVLSKPSMMPLIASNFLNKHLKENKND